MLQIPRQWWIPEPVEHLPLRRGWRQDVTLRSVIQGQLSEGSSFVMLPKPLLVLYQLAMLVHIQFLYCAGNCKRTGHERLCHLKTCVLCKYIILVANCCSDRAFYPHVCSMAST